MAVSTFEGLPLGTTTAAAAGFDFLAAPTGGGATVIDSNPYRGTRALQLTNGSTGGICYAERTTSVNSTATGTLYGRARFRLPVLSSLDASGVRVIVVSDSAGAFRAELRVTNGGKIQLRDAAGATLATSQMTIAANQWVDAGLAVLVFSTTVGQIQVAIWNGSGQIVETLTSAANLNTVGAGGVMKCQVGGLRSGFPGFVTVLDDVDWSTSGWPTIATNASVLNGPWAGALTDTGFTAAYRLSGATSARLVVSTSPDLSAPVYSPTATPDGDGIVKLTATGLTPNTQHYYGVEAGGALMATGRGEAKTCPAAGSAASYSVWFGSCQYTVPSDSTYAAILARQGPYGRALMGIHMGDMHYRDWGAATTAADILGQYVTSLGSNSMAPHLAKIPMSYIWDNHDWGGDVSDRTAAAGPVVAAQYRRVWPHYSLPATNNVGGYQSWVIGRVRYVQLDTRSYRDPQANADGASKTMLGIEQKNWFKAELLKPEPVKIICGNIYWRHDSASGGRWGSYGTEFTELNSWISANRASIGGLYVIFGDRHSLAADDGSAPGAQGMPQAGGAPIQQGSVAPGEPWSQGTWHDAPNTIQGFGWLNITDTGTDITIGYEGVSSLDGVVRVQMSTTFNTASPSLNALWGIRL